MDRLAFLTVVKGLEVHFFKCLRAAQLSITGPRESVMKKEAEYRGPIEHTEQRLRRRST